MAWVNMPNNPGWQYDNNPPDPGGAESRLWQQQTGGVRSNYLGQEVYTRVRKVGDPDETRGEMSKSFWDAR